MHREFGPVYKRLKLLRKVCGVALWNSRKNCQRRKKVKVSPVGPTSSDEEPIQPPPVLVRETTTLCGDEEPKKKPRAPRKKPIKQITE